MKNSDFLTTRQTISKFCGNQFRSVFSTHSTSKLFCFKMVGAATEFCLHDWGYGTVCRPTLSWEPPPSLLPPSLLPRTLSLSGGRFHATAPTIHPPAHPSIHPILQVVSRYFSNISLNIAMFPLQTICSQ